MLQSVFDILLGAVVPFVLIVSAVGLLKIYSDDKVIKWVEIAVEAAEQIYEHGENDEKFKYVSEYISKKFKISTDDLKNLIESAVHNLKEG